MIHRATGPLAIVWFLAASPIAPQEAALVAEQNDSVMVRIVDADLRTAVQALGRHLDRPVIFGAVQPVRVTLETPRPLPRSEVLDLLRSLLQSHDLDLEEDPAGYRVTSRGGTRPARPGGRPFLDTGPGDGTVELFVLRLRHARAADVAAVVNALFGRPGAPGELGGPVPTLSRQLHEQRIPPIDAGEPMTEAVAPGRSAMLSGEVVIVPDPRTNSILVRANPDDFEIIRAAVTQIDVRPLQVLIEVLIAEVRRDRSFALGVAVDVPPSRIPGSDATIEGSTTGIGVGDFALRVLNIGGIDWDLTLRAASARGDVTILSRPVVIAANNEQAGILVGSQRPFVQVQRTLPTDASVRDQVIQYRDVGTHLTVRPTVSDDGYVMLEVTQEVNAATTETAFDAPVISTRSVVTSLLVRDGQTAVLGGLSDVQRDATRSGVPVLSRIPLIGWLFGGMTRRTIETELFIFLTPRVLHTDEDLDDSARGVRERARWLRDPIGMIPPPPPARDTAPPPPETDR
jgi:general secretion pathway protein D